MKRNGGFSIAEVVIAMGVAAGLSAVLANFSKSVTNSNVKLRGENTLSSMREEMSVVSMDLPGWFQVLKATSGQNIDLCLVPNGPNYTNCPTACSVPSSSSTSNVISCPISGVTTRITDGTLKAESQGQRLSGMDLYDLSGTQFAGPPGSEIYTDLNGARCPQASDSQQNPALNKNCKFMSTGFMLINLVSQGTLPYVSLIRKIEQTPLSLSSGSPTVAPIYEKVVLGLLWRDLQGNGPDVGTVFAFAGTNIPTGFLVADGSTLTVTNSGATLLHQKLCTAIRPGGPCTSGSTFSIPDLRGHFIRGASGAAGSWPAGATQTTTAMAAHTHPGQVGAAGPVNLTVRVTFGGAGSLVGTPSQASFTWYGSQGLPFGTPSASSMIYPAWQNYGPWSISPAVGAALPGTVDIAQVSPTATVSASSAYGSVVSPSETRPSNAAVYYIIRDDYQ